MKIETDEAGLARVIEKLGLSHEALLGQGGQAWVLALDKERIVRVNRHGTRQEEVAYRNRLLAELGSSAAQVPFAIPEILETLEVEGYFVTVEKRLAGRPLDQVLSELSGQARDNLVRAYLEAAAQIGNLTLKRPWFGDLKELNPIRTATFQTYLEKRAAESLERAGPEFTAVNPARLAAALPEPEQAALVHLDAFPGNMLAERQRITAVIDFGVSTIMGDRRLDPLTAAVYLAPAITPPATDQDRATAQEWLAEKGLLEMFTAVQDWTAAYWSFARDDPPLYQWCRSVLLT